MHGMPPLPFSHLIVLSRRAKKTLYVVIPAVFAIWVIGHEFIWRFSSPLDLTQSVAIVTHSGAERTLYIHQFSTTGVDTARRSFRDTKHGVTSCTIWLDRSHDTLHTVATGRYFSDFRHMRICIDSSEQIMMIPNTEHGLPTGWGELLYLTPTDSLRTLQIINGNIADPNGSGREELLDMRTGRWKKLDPASGMWVDAAQQGAADSAHR